MQACTTVGISTFASQVGQNSPLYLLTVLESKIGHIPTQLQN